MEKFKKYEIIDRLIETVFFSKIQLVIDRAIESVKQAFGLPRLW